MKKKLCTLAWVAVLAVFVFLPVSCKKETPVSSFRDTSQTAPPGELPGLKQLLALNELNDSIKHALDLSQYQYYDNGHQGNLWIISLKARSFKLEKSKVFVGLQKGRVSVMVLAYAYDEAAYVHGNFKTYTGVISVYDKHVKKINDLRYKNGIIQQVLPPDCENCLLCYCPPPQPINWCTYWPVLCSIDNNPGVGQVEVPPGDGGGGGGIIYSPTVSYLTSVLSLHQQHSIWLQLNQNVAEDIKSALEEDDLSIEAQTAAKITISIATAHSDPYQLTNADISSLFTPYFYNSPADPMLYGIYFSMNFAIIKAENPGWPWWKIAYEASKETIHLMLDGAGLVPVIGEVFDLANATLYYLEGDGINATLSVASAIPIWGWYVQGIKYAKKAITALDGSTRTLKWVVKADNYISFGDRNLLRKVLGLAKGDPRTAHHIIPWEQGRHDLVQKAAEGNDAFHLNELLNGIPLSPVQHTGNHAIYNNKVRLRLDAIQEVLENKGIFTSTKARIEIERLIDDVIKPAILNNPNTPIDQIVF